MKVKIERFFVVCLCTSILLLVRFLYFIRVNHDFIDTLDL